MSKQFTPCPACGALGEVNCTCQFCGTTIILKEGTIATDSRIVKQRTVTPLEYANKISIYQNIIGLNSVISKVTIGNQEGIINLNGDLVYPLGNESITKYKDNTIQIGNKFLDLNTFEYINNPYYNDIVLEKIKMLSDAIWRNNQEESCISFGYSEDIDGFEIQNTNLDDCSRCGLTLIHHCISMDNNKQMSLLQRYQACDSWKLFESTSEDVYGRPLHLKDRSYYINFGFYPEDCCETLLRVLNQVYDISPEDAHKHMECFGSVFGEKVTNNNSQVSESSGCMGTLALLISTGAASIYGIVELIKHFIA